MKNNGYYSDFSWVYNSNFPRERIVYRYKNKDVKTVLENNNICAKNGYTSYYPNSSIKQLYKASSTENHLNHLDQNEIKYLVDRYRSDNNYWYSWFKFHNIRVHLTWYDNSSNHIAVADAINELGGIAAYWQTSFYGTKSIECNTNLDIGFYFSKLNIEISKSMGSNNKYYITTGYLNDHLSPHLKNRANHIRNKLKSAGAKKIVNIMDENSGDDSRWHTGNVLQRENYSYILEKVLEVPWLGVIFKPKKPNTLRHRLGPVNELLVAAEQTGRCIVLENHEKQKIKPPPLLAGLVADISIHGHLCAGTAALECALQGIPTLLIDREGTPHSKLNILPKGLVSFNNWPETIDALMEHFQTSGGVLGFGDWSQHIEEFDPFRDGKAAYRMGTYLHWLIQGFDQGLDRESIMEKAAEKYSHKWGSDKVISSNQI